MENLSLRNKLIASKKDKLFLKRSSEKLVNPKNYGNPLNLGVPNKTVISAFISIEENDTLIYDTHFISKVFKNLFSNF